MVDLSEKMEYTLPNNIEKNILKLESFWKKIY